MVQLVRGPHAPCPLPPDGGGGARGKRPSPARRAYALGIQILSFDNFATLKRHFANCQKTIL